MSTAPTHSSRERDRGFSLVEILIVIVIVGILATVTMFAVRGITDRGERVSCQTDARTLSDAATVHMISESIDAIAPTGTLDGDEFERTLVAEGLISGISPRHDLATDGSVTSSDPTCP